MPTTNNTHILAPHTVVVVEVALRLTVNQSASQYVEMSSQLWDLWLDITLCPKVVVWKLSLRGALFDERSGLSIVIIIL
jgi:hypothetical protein